MRGFINNTNGKLVKNILKRNILNGHFSIDIDGNVYDEELGIRIEDNVVVTGDGCDNLSSDCPKSVLDIEALCS